MARNTLWRDRPRNILSIAVPVVVVAGALWAWPQVTVFVLVVFLGLKVILWFGQK